MGGGAGEGLIVRPWLRLWRALGHSDWVPAGRNDLQKCVHSGEGADACWTNQLALGDCLTNTLTLGRRSRPAPSSTPSLWEAFLGRLDSSCLPSLPPLPPSSVLDSQVSFQGNREVINRKILIISALGELALESWT